MRQIYRNFDDTKAVVEEMSEERDDGHIELLLANGEIIAGYFKRFENNYIVIKDPRIVIDVYHQFISKDIKKQDKRYGIIKIAIANTLNAISAAPHELAAINPKHIESMIKRIIALELFTARSDFGEIRKLKRANKNLLMENKKLDRLEIRLQETLDEFEDDE